MDLNQKYYRDLWNSFQRIQLIEWETDDRVSILTIKMILSCIMRKQPVHFNFQYKSEKFNEISKQLFVEMANEIFCKSANFPPLKIGDKVRDKTAIRVGKPTPQHLDYDIVYIDGDKYSLVNKKYSIRLIETFTDLVTKFIPVLQSAQNKTLTRFTTFFEELNGKKIYDFSPTYFDQKTVFIGPKAFYENLDIKNKIPSTYLSNPREDGIAHETKSIPALPDSMIFFATKYETCYNAILKRGTKINTILILDTELEKIEQILQDRRQWNFNLVLLTNSYQQQKYSQMPCWNWFEEEAEILESI